MEKTTEIEHRRELLRKTIPDIAELITIHGVGTEDDEGFISEQGMIEKASYKPLERYAFTFVFAPKDGHQISFRLETTIRKVKDDEARNSG